MRPQLPAGAVAGGRAGGRAAARSVPENRTPEPGLTPQRVSSDTRFHRIPGTDIDRLPRPRQTEPPSQRKRGPRRAAGPGDPGGFGEGPALPLLHSPRAAILLLSHVTAGGSACAIRTGRAAHEGALPPLHLRALRPPGGAAGGAGPGHGAQSGRGRRDSELSHTAFRRGARDTRQGKPFQRGARVFQ